ncbi:MAG: hypothetical protein ACLP50_26850 [Solirubrobacteraceae bacterium]
MPSLTSLVDTGERLLDKHLSPGLSIHVAIGYEINPPPGETSAASAKPFIHTNALGHSIICQIAVIEPLFSAITKQSWREEAITHELFHCYQYQINPGINGDVGDWLIEGLARWVDLTLFASNPYPPLLAKSLELYFASSGSDLLRRKYDAVGFWGHLQDITGDLWTRIPRILGATTGGDDAALSVALAGVGQEHFYDTWGSSAFNHPADGPAWTAVSPIADAPYSAPLHPAVASTPETTVSIAVSAYSTDQVLVVPPTPPPGDTETLQVQLDRAYGRFGLRTDYTTEMLQRLVFKTSSSPQPIAPPSSCPPGTTPAPPSPEPALTPMPADGVLALAAAAHDTTVVLAFAPIAAPSTSGRCLPMTGGGDQGSSGGDPHVLDFHAGFFEFQAAGAFTLLRSTQDDLQVQVRQVPDAAVPGVSMDTAVAMRDAGATVEVDAAHAGDLDVYVDRRRVGLGGRRLLGGGAVSVTAKAATVTWPDGTTAEVDGPPGGFDIGLAGALSVQITVAHGRFGHLAGLLGDAGTSASTEFAARDGTVYSANEIVGTLTEIEDGKVPPLLYGAFGRSWLIPNRRASLFRATTAADLRYRPLTQLGLPAELAGVGARAPGALASATHTCTRAEVSGGSALQACELDVAKTHDNGFATTDRGLGLAQSSDLDQQAAGAVAPVAILPAPIALGPGTGPSSIAYDPGSSDTYVAWVADSGTSVSACMLPPGADACAGGVQSLTDPVAGSNVEYYNARPVILGATPVVVAEVDAAAAAAEPSGYADIGVLAWSGSPLTLDNGGKLLASSLGAGDLGSAGAVALDATHIAVAGNTHPHGSGFTDFTLGASAPATTPAIDQANGGENYGDQEGVTGSQLATIPDGPTGEVAVVVGGAQNPPGCPNGSSYATGYAAAAGAPATLADQSAWSPTYFQAISCDATSPALAGGNTIGLLEDEGPGLNGSGADGIYYRPFNPSTMTFSATPTLVSDETSLSNHGADELSLSEDSSGGLYASWLDSRGFVIAYSSTDGATWTAPLTTNLGGSNPGTNPVIAGTGGGAALIAFDAGDEEELQPVPASDLAP